MDLTPLRHNPPQVWSLLARCAPADMGKFFSHARSLAEQQAVELCTRCTVRTECLAWALDQRIPYGVFGGATPRRRQAILQRSPAIPSWHDALTRARDAQARRHRKVASARRPDRHRKQPPSPRQNETPSPSEDSGHPPRRTPGPHTRPPEDGARPMPLKPLDRYRIGPSGTGKRKK
ncbi:WhiB family transcriptional regulator [Streptomyces sp. NPDC001404]|uniref:WhiB family transcriptional regulator n=1 Tax=Streptomyces sp. NPDC001404 TaxID=3364571 RepID=UPI00368BEC9A